MKYALPTLALALATAINAGATRGAAPAPPAAIVETAARAAGGAGAAGSNGAGSMALNRAFYATEFDTMDQQLTLTDDQKARLREKIDAMNKELDQFVQGAQPQIVAARRAARGGGSANGAVAAGAGRGRGANVLAGNPVVVKLQNDLQLLANQHQMLLNQELTPEQRLQWESYKLTRVLEPRLLPLGLTDDQKDRVKALEDDAAKQLAALTDGKTVQEIQGKLYRTIVGDVLTDVQVGKLMSGILPVQLGGAGRGAAGGGTGAANPGGGAVVPGAAGLP